VFISWNGWIEKTDNDNAISHLLKHLIEDNLTISEAVRGTPSYISRLDYYPHSPEVANYRVPNYKQSNISCNSMVLLAASNLNKVKLIFKFHMN